MSLINSLKQLIVKLEQKNIVLCSGNIDEIIPISISQYFTMFKYLNLSFSNQNNAQDKFIDLIDFICEVGKELKYTSIKYFSPSKGMIDYLDTTNNIKQEENNEFSDIPSSADNSSNNLDLDSFIESINNEFVKSANSTKICNKLFLIKLGDILLDRQSGMMAGKLAKLVNIFLELQNKIVTKFAKNKIKLVILAKSSNGFNQLISNNNVEFCSVNIQLPDKNERKEFYTRYANQFESLKSSCKQPNHNDFKEVITLSDGMSLRELFQFSKINDLILKPDLSFKELYSLVSFNKQTSEWENIDLSRMQNIKSILSNRVKGQDYAIDCAYRSLVRSFSGMNGILHSADNNKKPKGILFFVGPTGVGKTELAKSISEFVFGDENRIIRFDMSEFNHEHSDQRLIGAPPGYVGYDAGGELTNAVKQKPFSILLFDEIEKAHGKILDKFLQILEDGRLKSAQGEVIDFSETFIIFTSNIGSSSFTGDINNQQEVRTHFMNEVINHFNHTLGRPELLNRISTKNIVPFSFICDEHVMKNIVESKVQKMVNSLKEKAIYLKLSENFINSLISQIKSSFNKQMGGRGVITELETYLVDPLSEFIFQNYQLIKDNQENDKVTNIEINCDSKLSFTII